MLLSREGLVLECNRALVLMAGSDRRSIIGHPAWEALDFPARTAGATGLREAVALAAQGQSVPLELVREQAGSPSGPQAWQAQVRPLADENGRIAFLVFEACLGAAESGREQEAERRLAAAEHERSRLQELLAHTPAAIAIVSGPEHRWTFVNEEYVRMTGRGSAEDFLGKKFAESLPELDVQPFQQILDDVYRTGESCALREQRVSFHCSVDESGANEPSRAGSFDCFFRPIRSAGGAVEGVFLYTVEVTDKVADRRAIEEIAERLRLAHSAGQIGTWEWDPVKDETRLSPETHRMFGTDADDPEGARKWTAGIYPADRERVDVLMWEGHRRGSMEFEYRYRHPELGLRWIYTKGMRLPGETRMFGIVQDVTARKAAEQDAQRLAAIVASSNDAIVSKDLNGIVTSWNAGAERIFGYTAEEMIGKPITKIIPTELYAEETRILSTIASGERIEHFETVRVKKNGELVDMSLTISPVRDPSGAIVGAAKIARDITHQKRAERALHTSERLASVGRLAATVAHEINNPLEAVTNLIFLARGAEQPQVVKFLDMAQEELERISHLTRQTLGFYRETKGVANVRLGDLVESLLSVFGPRMRNKGIRLSREITDDVEISAVPGEIRQVIANLISNSIDAVNGGGQIRVRVQRATHRKDGMRAGVRLTVADTGSGIPADIRSQLFEPFFTTKKDVGTGLGLWICKSIVETHQGSIRMRSSTQAGRSGTVFSIFLPAKSGA